MLNRILITIFFLLFSLTIAQEVRYLDEVFDDVLITEDIVYGNAPDLPFIFLFEWNTVDIDLDMDIYEPAGDTLDARPAIIFIHTGAFFSGHNELDDVVDLSIASAKRGYVSFNINYRLGLNILSSYSGERAVYRGMQDASAAIRHIREFHEEYNIDPNKIFIWGTSAGSLIGLHLAYSQEDERPESTYGTSTDPDLGCIDCSGNSYIQNNKPNALVSCWGAIGDLNWIDPEDNIPTLMFHGTVDPVVPFNSGFPFTVDIALPIVYGSNLIYNRLQNLNIDSELHAPVELHEYWGTVNGNWFTGPNDYYDQILSNSYSFLYNYLNVSLGDFNNDNNINILDIIILANYVLNPESTELDGADINNDNNVDILDIVQLVNIVLNN